MLQHGSQHYDYSGQEHCFSFLPLSNASATNLQTDGGGADQKERLAVPHVNVEAVEGQVAQKAALLAGLEERIVHTELQLKAWTPWRWGKAEQRER